MRSQLKALEGQLVTVTGRNTEFKRSPDGKRAFFMVKNPVIRAWDGYSRLPCQRKDPGVRLDHIWLEKNLKMQRVTLLEEVVSIGRVGYYVRSDGSHDLGIRDLAKCLAVDWILDGVADRHNEMMSGDQFSQLLTTYSELNSLQSFLDQHGKRDPEDGRVCYVISQRNSFADVKHWLNEQLRRLERTQATLLRAKVGHLPRRSADTQSPPPGSAIFLGKQTQPHFGEGESELERLLRDAG